MPAPPGASDYDPGDGYDEAFSAPGEVREHYADVMDALAETGLERAARRSQARLADEEVSFGGRRGRGVRGRPGPAGADRVGVVGAHPRACASACLRSTRSSPTSTASAARSPKASCPRTSSRARRSWRRICVDVEPRRRRPRRDRGPRRGPRPRRDVHGARGQRPHPVGQRVRASPRRRRWRPSCPCARPHAAAARGWAMRYAGAWRPPTPDADGELVLLTDGPVNSAWYEHRRLADLAGLRLARPEELRRRRARLELPDGRPVRAVYRRTDESGCATRPAG